ncbi:uncharacterized protein [Palaemon carinicauda]|uniref:uncharacterized protein n=1 Tax=Palaemon carinicauda TaxID=392227 RepID=UPI0035B60904
MKVVVIVAFGLLTCSTNTEGNQVDNITSREEKTEVYKSPLQLRSASENSTESLIIREVYQPTSIIQGEETVGLGTETEDLFIVLLCNPESKTILVKKDFLVNNAVLDHICAEGREKVPENHQGDDSVSFRISRTKRDVNDTETPGSEANTQEIELPKAEPWIFPSRPQSIGNILGQQIANHHRRNPSHDSNLPTSSLNIRIQPNPSTPQLDNKLPHTTLKQDKISEINGKGPLSSGNGISRQYFLADSYSRYPEIPIRHQQNYYAPPPFPSLGEAGVSLLNLLNPLNLFRMPGPPQPPIGSNPLPYNNNNPLPYNNNNPLPYNSNPLPFNNNPLPSNINNLPYNNNHLRHIANPVRPSIYDIRQPTWSEDGHSYGSHGDDPFLEKGRIKYEIIKDNKKHEFGFEFMEDSQLRDDIYVGKDGNLYIKDDNTYGNSQSSFDIESYAGDGKDLSFEVSSYDDEKDLSPVQNKGIPQGNLEEPDIEDPNTFEEQYQELLKNHNMNEESPKTYGTHFKDFVTGHREIYDINSLDYYEGDPFSENKKPNSLREVPSDWVSTPPGRINYPTYFYVPRTVIIPPMHRSRLRRPSPPRAGSSSTSNLRLSGLNPLSSFLFPSSISRPLSQGYEVSDDFNRLSNGHRKSTNYKDLSGTKAQSSTTSGTRKMTNGHGFYPGNGFFEADFPTVFQMSPFKQSMEHLSAALRQNGTLLIDMKNSTITTAQ